MTSPPVTPVAGDRSSGPVLKTYTACMPAEELSTLDSAARKAHVSRSFAIREGVKLWMKAQARG